MKKYIAIAIALALNTGIYAQITIGSNSQPSPGSLLDLKEFVNTTGGATATKGLLLPRVAISDTDVLQIAPDDQKVEHIGTIVYAVFDEPDEPTAEESACSSIPRVDSNSSGVMVWTGTKWVPLVAKEETTTGPSLPSWVHPAVKVTKPDHEENTYTYRYFGNPAHQYITRDEFVASGGNAADYQNFGYWMTENLRSKKYASNHPGVELSLVRYKAGDLGTSLIYGYPQKMPKPNMQDADDFNEFPSLGLLYSGGAITGAVNGVITVTPNMQGICPDGWFLPTKSDWDGLIAYLELPEQKAQYTTYDTQLPIVEHTVTRTLTTICNEFMDHPTHTDGSRGKVAREGAFGLVAVGWGRSTTGVIENNKIFEYPETPDSGISNGLPFRSGSASTTLNPIYYSFNTFRNPLDTQMISVRCRTNVNPEL